MVAGAVNVSLQKPHHIATLRLNGVVNDHPKYGYEEGNDYQKILYSQYLNSRFVRFSSIQSLFLVNSFILAHPPSVEIAHEWPSKAFKIPNSDFYDYVEQWRGVTEISREAACNLYLKNFVRCYPLSANLI
jgi:hypothetical protein